MRANLICILATLLAAGCVHTPRPAGGPDLPPDAPALAEIRNDLGQANRRIANFTSSGTITMRLPGDPATQRFTRSHIRYHQPDKFFVSATKAVHTVRIYTGGNRFLLDHQSERLFYFGQDGDRFPDVSLDVAPSIILREFFFSDVLATLEDKNTVLRQFDPSSGEAELDIFRDKRRRSLERRLRVAKGPEGWQVLESALFDNSGDLVVRTRYEDYRVVDGVLMATHITASLPDDNGVLGFQALSNIQVNRRNPAPIEEVLAVRESLVNRGYTEVRGVPAEVESR